MAKAKKEKVRTVICGLCRLPVVVSGPGGEKKALKEHFKKNHGAQ